MDAKGRVDARATRTGKAAWFRTAWFTDVASCLKFDIPDEGSRFDCPMQAAEPPPVPSVFIAPVVLATTAYREICRPVGDDRQAGHKLDGTSDAPPVARRER